LKLQGVLEVFWANSFEGVLGVVRKSRWVLYSVFFLCIFKTKFLEKIRGYMKNPLSPPHVHLCNTIIELEKFLTITKYKYK
jgi:hypothetical protein